MKEKIESLKSVVSAFEAKTADELEAIRIKYLSKKGIRHVSPNSKRPSRRRKPKAKNPTSRAAQNPWLSAHAIRSRLSATR